MRRRRFIAANGDPRALSVAARRKSRLAGLLFAGALIVIAATSRASAAEISSTPPRAEPAIVSAAPVAQPAGLLVRREPPVPRG
jgi:hypothetical protein